MKILEKSTDRTPFKSSQEISQKLHKINIMYKIETSNNVIQCSLSDT